MPILHNLLIRPSTELEFHILDGNHGHNNSQQMSSHESQLHELTAPQHGNLINIHHLQQQNMENIQIQAQNHYILQPSHHNLMQHPNQQHNVIYSSGNNHLIQNNSHNGGQSNLAMNINSGMNKDNTVIHLGNHYVNLQPVQNLNSHQNIHQTLINNPGCAKPDYHFVR